LARPAIQARAAAPIFFALGDELRLRLVSRLCEEGPQSIAQLSEGAKVTRQAIRKHLVTLSSAGLVRERKQGRERVFELQPARVDGARQYLKAVSRRWDDALARLKSLVEE
jgi:DNA-binding transcriptional ArsR family regulator